MLIFAMAHPLITLFIVLAVCQVIEIAIRSIFGSP